MFKSNWSRDQIYSISEWWSSDSNSFASEERWQNWYSSVFPFSNIVNITFNEILVKKTLSLPHLTGTQDTRSQNRIPYSQLSFAQTFSRIKNINYYLINIDKKLVSDWSVFWPMGRSYKKTDLRFEILAIDNLYRVLLKP